MFASVEVQKKSRGKNNHVHTDVYTVLLPSSKMSKVSDPLRSILCTVDQKPLTWKDVLLHVVLIDEWVYECLELVIRYLYRSPFWNILKSTIICYMILLDLFIFQSNMDTAEWKVMVSSVDDFYVVTAKKSALTNESHARKLYGW